jgi:hypothetical protein
MDVPVTVGPGGDHSTISAAAAAGDTVLISGGVYREQLRPPRDGMTFRAVPGERVVIDGGGRLGARAGFVHNGLVNLSHRAHITIIGITVQGSGSHGVWAERASDVLLRDCEVAGSFDGGIVFTRSARVAVRRCDVHGNNAHGVGALNEAVSFDHTRDFEISSCTVHHNGEEGIDAKYGSSGRIVGNHVHDNRGPNIYVDSADGVEVVGNVVHGTGQETKAGIGLAVEKLSRTRRCANVWIANNVVFGNQGGGIGFWVQESGTFHDIAIVNNTVVGNLRPGVDARDYAGVFTGTNLLRNNIVVGNAGGELSSGASAFVADHNVFSAAAFVSATDFRLAPGSAGIGTGSPDGAPGVDIDGVPRVGPIDVGAYQTSSRSVSADVRR